MTHYEHLLVGIQFRATFITTLDILCLCFTNTLPTFQLIPPFFFLSQMLFELIDLSFKLKCCLL